MRVCVRFVSYRVSKLTNKGRNVCAYSLDTSVYTGSHLGHPLLESNLKPFDIAGLEIFSLGFSAGKGAFTQSILRGVIRRRFGYLINKKYFFH